jgi:large subunit ribosomal protein L24
VISGVEEGKTGNILQVFPEKNQVLVEGLRMIKKHAKRTQDRPDGGIIEREGPIHISNVKLVSKSSAQ